MVVAHRRDDHREAAIPIERLDVSAYPIPTDAPESDGTLAWDSTTMVLVAVHAAGCTGTGYTYAVRKLGVGEAEHGPLPRTRRCGPAPADGTSYIQLARFRGQQLRRAARCRPSTSGETTAK